MPGAFQPRNPPRCAQSQAVANRRDATDVDQSRFDRSGGAIDAGTGSTSAISGALEDIFLDFDAEGAQEKE